MIHGIDVSSYNGSIDWQKVRDAGKDFAFIKINEGDYIDGTAKRERIQAARKAGVLIGGYNFLRPRSGRTGDVEFNVFWEHCRSIGLHGLGALRPVLDVEATGFTGPLATYKTKRYIKQWIRACIHHTGMKPLLYTGYFWRDNLGNWNDSSDCALWLAEYNSRLVPSLTPKPWQKSGVSFWQYSEKGSVAGVGGNVDLDVYLGHDRKMLISHHGFR